MQVQIISGESGTGKTARLEAIQADLKSHGIEAPIIVGRHFTTPYFLNQISQHAIAGGKYFLADDCTQFQVRSGQCWHWQRKAICRGCPTTSLCTWCTRPNASQKRSTTMTDSMNNALAQIWAYQQQRPAIVDNGTAALTRLIPIALDHTGQSEVVGRFLLGLYNGPENHFDLTDLRRLDLAVFEDCIRVLAMDYMPEQEVHERVPNGNSIWRQLNDQWGSQAVAP